MQLFFSGLLKSQSYSLHRHHCRRNFADTAVKWVRDRGLDHAVEREKNLKPLLNIKNLIKSEPSKSLPITIITQQKESLEIPIRPIDFIRKYPSVFQEFLPGNIGVHPHINLTPEVLNLDAEEQLVYRSENYKQLVANRLLKLLMISRVNRVPLKLVDVLKWDLGLPQDYVKSVVPEFPDYFRVMGSSDGKDFCFGLGEIGELELVCWSNELAVSVMEKKAVGEEEIVFSTQFSSGFEMDKTMKKWVNEWQKLPYISPYENASHLLPKSDESDKWAVAILHEVLSLFGAKKAKRENLLCLGEYLGVRSRFKRALLNHPGIFYVSSKTGTCTVVLREGYKRGALIESDPLMNIRNQYIHLMNILKEDLKVIAMQSGKQHEKGVPLESKGEEEDVVKDSEGEKDVRVDDLSGLEEEEGDVSDDDYEDDEDEEKEVEDRRGASRNASSSRGRTTTKMNLEMKMDLRNPERGKSIRKNRRRIEEKLSPKDPRRREMQAENNISRNSGERLKFTRSQRRTLSEKKTSV